MSDVLSDYNQFVRFAGTLAETGTQTFENVSATGTLQAGTTVTAGTALVGQDVSISGLTGAVVATRYVGGTASVAPTTGTFALGDWVVSSTGRMWVCTVAGTPGTWVEPASVAFAPLASPTFTGTVSVPSLSVSGLTGSVVASRYVGQTASGAPTTGAHLVGDWATSTAGELFVCTVAATPGTWVQVIAGSLAALAPTNAMVSASAAIAVSKLAPGLAGQLFGGTTPGYLYPPGFEIAYDQITSGVNVVATAEGTPTAIIAGTAHTYENVPYVAEFFSASVTDSSAAAGTLTVLLIADGSSIGRIAVSDSVTVSTQIIQAITGKLRFTPTAAAHTYSVSAFASSTTGTPAVGAGAGGSGVLVPAFLRITKA